MDFLVLDFHVAQRGGKGHLLSTTLLPESPQDDPTRLKRIFSASNLHDIESDLRSSLLTTRSGLNMTRAEGNAWVDLYASYYRTVREIVYYSEGRGTSDHTSIYDAWKEMTNVLIRGYSSGHFQAWTIPCLYVAGKYLRIFAIKADEHARSGKPVTYGSSLSDDIDSSINKNEKLEDAARVINRIFQLCISDRAPLENSRKWGLYYATNLLFKTYFKLNSISLSRNILRALSVSYDTPPESAFPQSQISTFHYYAGIIAFLDEDYPTAEEHLTRSLKICHRLANHNKEMILTYLIPCHLLTTHLLPSAKLLALYPRLQKLFQPLAQCIKHGDLSGFDAALAQGEEEFVKRRIYLTLERGRDIALRNLFRKVFLLGGFIGEAQPEDRRRRTRIPIHEFQSAVALSMDSHRSSSTSSKSTNGTKLPRVKIDRDEVECLLSNMIYKNLMKGYISQPAGMVVLSKGAAFPGTGV